MSSSAKPVTDLGEPETKDLNVFTRILRVNYCAALALQDAEDLKKLSEPLPAAAPRKRSAKILKKIR